MINDYEKAIAQMKDNLEKAKGMRIKAEARLEQLIRQKEEIEVEIRKLNLEPENLEKEISKLENEIKNLINESKNFLPEIEGEE